MRLVDKKSLGPSEHCSDGGPSQVCMVSPQRGDMLHWLRASPAAPPAEPPTVEAAASHPQPLYLDPICHGLRLCPEANCQGLSQGLGSLAQGPCSVLFLRIPRRHMLQLGTVVTQLRMYPFWFSSLSCLLPPLHLP